MSASLLSECPWALTLLGPLLLATLIAGCSPADRPGTEVFAPLMSPPASGPPVADADIPVPSELRAFADVTSTVFMTGNLFRTTWHPLQLVTESVPDSAVFSPDYSPGGGTELAYATYQFNIGGYAHESTLTTDWAAAGDYADCWIGMADFVYDTWRWYDLTATNEIQFDESTCISGGTAYAIVVLTGTDPWELRSIYLGSSPPPHIIGVDPLVGYAGDAAAFEAILSQTPGAGTTWSWNFGNGAAPNQTTDAQPLVALAGEGVYQCTVEASNAAGSSNHEFILNVCAADSEWHIEAVAPASAIVAVRSSLALDPGTGRPQIAYKEAWSNRLQYARSDGNAWWIETLDPNVMGFGFGSRSLDLDSAGNPHVAYYKAPHLIHIWHEDLAWRFENVVDAQVEPQDYDYYANSLALNSADHPLIAFAGQGDTSDVHFSLIGLAAQNGGDWVTQEAALRMGFPYCIEFLCPMGLDPFDIPHIAYHDLGPPNELRCSIMQPGGEDWDDKPVGDGTGLLAADLGISQVNGTPHICYAVEISPNVGELRYGVFLEGVWSVYTVAGTGNVGPYVSMAISSTGKPSICYYEQGLGDLCYLERDMISWPMRIVDAEGNVGLHCCLALDSSSHPHFTYQDQTQGYLKYARLRVGIGET